MSQDLESQQHELLALASIYDDDEFHRSASAHGGEMRVFPELPPDFKIVVRGTEYDISFLALSLDFQLPPEYPSSSSPRFTLNAAWLTRAQLSSLRRRLDELWEENRGSVVLFTWFQFLKEEALDFLGIRSPLEIARESGASNERGSGKSSEKGRRRRQRKPSIRLDPHAVPSPTAVPDSGGDILPQLLELDEARRQKEFDGKLFSCSVCLAGKLGALCLRFDECRHVYCKACVTEYFQTQIRDGQVWSLGCPAPTCSSVATPRQVKQLVDEELYARYDRLLLRCALDRMEDVVYCPRKSCATAVWMEPDGIMAVCSNCCYAFCVNCKLAHHAKAPCRINQELRVQLLEEYLSASKEGKKLLEKRFGKRTIEVILADSLSAEWVHENCKLCPYCRVNIQKEGGCNKVTCSSCKKYFCWLCLLALPKDPYKHFNNPGTGCYNRLFHG